MQKKHGRHLCCSIEVLLNMGNAPDTTSLGESASSVLKLVIGVLATLKKRGQGPMTILRQLKDGMIRKFRRCLVEVKGSDFAKSHE